ncbi:hypothetical protein AAMO2058_000191100 [Amorphochlora amoebiformis]
MAPPERPPQPQPLRRPPQDQATRPILRQPSDHPHGQDDHTRRHGRILQRFPGLTKGIRSVDATPHGNPPTGSPCPGPLHSTDNTSHQAPHQPSQMQSHPPTRSHLSRFPSQFSLDDGKSSDSQGQDDRKTNQKDPTQPLARHSQGTSSGHHHRPASRAQTGIPPGTSVPPEAPDSSNTGPSGQLMAPRPIYDSRPTVHHRATVVAGPPAVLPSTTPPPPNHPHPHSPRHRRLADRSRGRPHLPPRRAHVHPDHHTSGTPGTNTPRGAEGSQGRYPTLPKTGTRYTFEYTHRFHTRSRGDQPMGHKRRTGHTTLTDLISMGRHNKHDTHGHLHQHTSEHPCGPPLTQHHSHPSRTSRDATSPPFHPGHQTSHLTLGVHQGGHQQPTLTPTHTPDRHQHSAPAPTTIGAPTTDPTPKEQTNLICLSPTQSGRSSSPPGPILGERHNRPPSPLASCPMVQQGRATIGQPPTPPIPGCHHPFTPICSLTPELGMDWGAALRQAEQKANVPEGVGTRFRIHHNTYRQYAGAWAALRAFAQNTQIPPTLPRHRPTSEILNHTVALYAAHLTKKGASQSQLTHASAAVRHYTATLSATPDDIRAWAARRMNRDRPSIPRNDTVPSIHDLLDIAIRIPAHNRIELRDRTIALFLLFTHARQSDITGIYRHHATFRVGHLPLDAPSWARGPSRAAPMLTRLGYIPDYKHRSNHHVYVDVRYHLPKRAAAQGLRYGNWVRLLEQPFSPSTCPVYHLARYLTATKALDIDAVPLPNHEHEEFRARPLFVSEGRQHHELKESTIGGIIRRRVIQYIYGRKFTPHITRACSASYKIAYGVPRDTVKMIGNWTTDEAFNKHYLRVTYPPVHHARLTDALYHDWAIARAHQLYTTQKLTTTSSQ